MSLVGPARVPLPDRIPHRRRPPPPSRRHRIPSARPPAGVSPASIDRICPDLPPRSAVQTYPWLAPPGDRRRRSGTAPPGGTASAPKPTQFRSGLHSWVILLVPSPLGGTLAHHRVRGSRTAQVRAAATPRRWKTRACSGRSSSASLHSHPPSSEVQADGLGWSSLQTVCILTQLSSPFILASKKEEKVHKRRCCGN